MVDVDILFFYWISHQVFGAAKVNSITASQVMINSTVKQYRKQNLLQQNLRNIRQIAGWTTERLGKAIGVILFFHWISHQVFGAVKVNSITASQVVINLTVKQYTKQTISDLETIKDRW